MSPQPVNSYLAGFLPTTVGFFWSDGAGFTYFFSTTFLIAGYSVCLGCSVVTLLAGCFLESSKF